MKPCLPVYYSCFLYLALVLFLTPGLACAETDPYTERYYPADNDADYSMATTKSKSTSGVSRNYPSDNDESYVPFVLQDNPPQQPAKAAPAQPASPPAHNTQAYPNDNDSDYKAPNPKGSDGDKYYYPLYY